MEKSTGQSPRRGGGGAAPLEVYADQGSEELKARLWPVFCRYYPDYQVYQDRTDRVIPLVVLKVL